MSELKSLQVLAEPGNRKAILLAEIGALIHDRGRMRRMPEAVRKVIGHIIAGYRPQRMILHGSFARGDYHEGSDLDLIIVKSTEERFIDRIEHVLEFSDGEIAIEPLVYTEGELNTMLAEGNVFLEKALEEGIVIYEQ